MSANQCAAVAFDIAVSALRLPFDTLPPPTAARLMPPCVPAVPHASAPRLSAQCRRILALLEERPRSNRELSEVALKYTGRLSDLRAAGYAIECFDENHKTGLSFYRLTGRPATEDTHA